MTNQRSASTQHVEPTAREFSTTRGILLLWFSVLAGPIAWALNQEISYLFVPWACASGTRLMLHAVTLAALLLSLAGAFVGWRCWHRTGAEWHDAEGGVIGRSRLMALGGIALGAMFALVILAQGYPSLVLSPCP